MAGERDRGQAVLQVAMVLAITVVLVIAAGRMASRTIAAACARSAADAAALAGVTGGPGAAAALARYNGGRLVSVTVVADRVRVVVECDGERATAMAAATP